MNILLSRTDRLGDLVQSLAAVRSLKEHFPGGSIGFLIAKSNAPVLADNPHIDKVHFIEETTVEEMRRCKYEAAVVMFYDRRVTKLIKGAAIPRRVGPLSQIGSLFAFNEGIRQHRSASLKNEAEYNVDLVRAICSEVVAERPIIYNKGVQPAFDLPDKYAVLAPQSRSSAPNIADEMYKELAGIIVGKGIPLVVTGTATDSLCEQIANDNTGVLNVAGKTTLDELIFLIQRSLFVVAPSTGTLHLANALGRPIISFYPPAGTVSAIRWSPFRYEGKIFSSPYPCKRKTCRKNSRSCEPCMRFDVSDEVSREVDRLLQESRGTVPRTK